MENEADLGRDGDADSEREIAENAILHPLASVTVETQEWVNQLPHNIEAGGFQSVCLDESVYISENPTSSFGNKSVLHKCSMQKRSYYKLPSHAEGYALAVYRSKVLMIGGRILSFAASSDDIYPKKPISVLRDSSLEESLNSAMKDLYKIGRNACAVGEGDFLIVIGGDGPYEDLANNNQEYVRVFDGRNWCYGVIAVPAESSDIRSQRKCLLVFQNRLYMTAYGSTSTRTKFYYTSLDCFKNQLDSQTTLTWNRLGNVPDGARCTNLSVVGNQLVTVGYTDRRFVMYAYLATSATWTGVHEFQPPVTLSYMAGIIGIPCSSFDHVEALLVGVDHNQLTHIFKVTSKSQPYNPNSNIEIPALSKLEGLVNIPVLTNIENNAEMFMDTAGFKLATKYLSKVRLAYEYIGSWKREKNPIYKPTWSGLLAVLRQIGLDSLAQNIDSILKKTSPSVEDLDEHKDPDNAMVLLMKLNERLSKLSKNKIPKRLQKGVVACKSECDAVLQKARIEKRELETALESRDAGIDKLKKEVEFHRSLLRVKGRPYQSQSSSSEGTSNPEPTLKELVYFLFPVASQWYCLGLLMDVDANELDKIEVENPKDSNNCLVKMLKKWVKMVQPKPSWSTVIEALKGIQENQRAETIHKLIGHATQTS